VTIILHGSTTQKTALKILVHFTLVIVGLQFINNSGEYVINGLEFLSLFVIVTFLFFLP
jgi:hypothetical protein